MPTQERNPIAVSEVCSSRSQKPNVLPTRRKGRPEENPSSNIASVLGHVFGDPVLVRTHESIVYWRLTKHNQNQMHSPQRAQRTRRKLPESAAIRDRLPKVPKNLNCKPESLWLRIQDASAP